jgi:hypothetical protein
MGIKERTASLEQQSARKDPTIRPADTSRSIHLLRAVRTPRVTIRELSTAHAEFGTLRFARPISEQASFRLCASHGYNGPILGCGSSILRNGESSKTNTSASISFVCAG